MLLLHLVKKKNKEIGLVVCCRHQDPRELRGPCEGGAATDGRGGEEEAKGEGAAGRREAAVRGPHPADGGGSQAPAGQPGQLQDDAQPVPDAAHPESAPPTETEPVRRSPAGAEWRRRRSAAEDSEPVGPAAAAAVEAEAPAEHEHAAQHSNSTTDPQKMAQHAQHCPQLQQ